MAFKSHIPPVSETALARAAASVLANALSATFNPDPVIGPEASRAISVLGSIVKRHGLLLQQTLANALAASGRFDVLVDVGIPIVEAANELLLAPNSAEDLARISIRADASADRIVNLDLFVIDQEVGWAGLYDVKRGNGPIHGRTRRPLEHDLKAGCMVLSSYLAKRGYPNITRVTAGVIDYYGFAGFNKKLKIGRDDLDDHFQVPVRATLEKVTDCLRDALRAELPDLFSTVLEAIHRDGIKKSTAASGNGLTCDLPQVFDSVTVVINPRPQGPGPRKPS